MDEPGRRNCPVCGGETSEILATKLRRGHGVVFCCRDCDHGFLMPEGNLDAKKFYAEQYRQEYSHKAQQEATNARELFDVYKRYQQSRLSAVESRLTSKTKLLEVGASAGQFLWHVKDRVKVANAIELDKSCRTFLERELLIDADDEYLERSRFKDEVYDVVCAFQVMEHVENPVEFLKTLKAATGHGGALFVEVPNLHDPLLSIWNVPTYRSFYYHSAHLHYFSETSLRKVAKDAGFNESSVKIDYVQDYNLLNHLHWVMNNGPQADCHIGLSEIALAGANLDISGWLTQELKVLNRRYVDKLVATKNTSNLLMTLQNA